VQKSLSLVTQTPLISPLTLWNRLKGYAQPTIQFDARGNQVNIEDSDSDDDRKMPAKISCKKTKKVADPMDTEDKKENSDTDSD
jgi:hypothetical protein